MPTTLETLFSNFLGEEPRDEESIIKEAIIANLPKLRLTQGEMTKGDRFAFEHSRFAPPEESTMTGLGEAALTVGTGLLGMAAGGEQALERIFFKNPAAVLGLGEFKDPEKDVEYWAEKLTYQPGTEKGQEFIGKAMWPFEMLRKIADFPGHGIQDALLWAGASPETAANTGAIVSLGIELRVLSAFGDIFRVARGKAAAPLRGPVRRLNSALRRGAGVDKAANELLNTIPKLRQYGDLPFNAREALEMLKTGEVTPKELVENSLITSNEIVRYRRKHGIVPEGARFTEAVKEVKPGDVKGMKEVIDKVESEPKVVSKETKPEVPDLSNPDYTFTSQKGNNYIKVGNTWYKEGKPVTNKFVIKAAEKRKVRPKIEQTIEPETVPAAKGLVEKAPKKSKPKTDQWSKTDEGTWQLKSGLDEIGIQKFSYSVQKGYLQGKGEGYHLRDENAKYIKTFKKLADAKEYVEGLTPEKPSVPSTKAKLEVSPVTRSKAATKSAERLGLKFEGELTKDEIVRDDYITTAEKKKGIKAGDELKVKYYQFFDPVTGERFISRSPNLIEVTAELEAFRDIWGAKSEVSKKMTFQDFNKEANDIISGKSDMSAKDFLKTLREFTEDILDTDIGPGKRFETTADVLEHTSMGRDFASKFRRKAIEIGLMEEPGIDLNMMIPVDRMPKLVGEALGAIRKTGKMVRAKDIFRNKELFDKTGFWFARDGKWRYELDDSNIKVVREVGDQLLPGHKVMLNKLIEHPDLFRSVPGLNNVVVYRSQKAGKGGRYSQETYTIELNADAGLRILIHEVQHAVNSETGAFRGTTVEAAGGTEAYMIYPGEMEARLTEKRMKMTAEERRTTPPWETLDDMLIEEGLVPIKKGVDLQEAFEKGYSAYDTKAGPGAKLYSGIPADETAKLAEDTWLTLNRRTKQISRALQEGRDISAKLSPESAERFKKILDTHEKNLSGSEQRGFFEIASDLYEVIPTGDRTKLGMGAGGINFTHSQKIALQRLVADAKRVGQKLEGYLKDLGFDPSQISACLVEQAKWKREIEPLSDKQPVGVEFKETTPGDRIVMQRKLKKLKDGTQLTAIEVYKSEFDMMEGANELKRPRKWDATIRTFEEGNVKPLYWSWRAANNSIIREMNDVNASLRNLGKDLKISRKSKKRITAYAHGKQPHGEAIMKAAGHEVPIELTEPEMTAYNNMRAGFKDFIERANEVRKQIGREPIEILDDYFTFARTTNLMAKKGVFLDLVNAPKEVITKAYEHYKDMLIDLSDRPVGKRGKYKHFRATPFVHEMTRTGGLFAPEMDSFKIYRNYANRVVRHIYMSPVVAKVSELVNIKLPGPDGVKLDPIIMRKPKLGEFLNNWSSFISGRPVPSDLLGPSGEKLVRMLRTNLVASSLTYLVRTGIIQQAAHVNTIALLDLKYWLKGVADNFDPEMRKFAMKESEGLLSRVPEAEFGDWYSWGKAKQAGFAHIQLLDMEAARTAYLAARRFGTDILKLKGKDLVHFADDIVARTQGSGAAGDIAPIQYSELGKSITMFQTFNINNWDLMTGDILNMKGAKISDPIAYDKAFRLILGITIANIIFEDICNVPSPFPRPIKTAYEGIRRDEPLGRVMLDVAKELMEPVKVVGGSFRYGRQLGGPAVEWITEVGKKFTDKPMQKSWTELLAAGAGVHGTAQATKYMRGRERGKGIVGSIVGTYSEEDKYSRKPSRRARSERPGR